MSSLLVSSRKISALTFAALSAFRLSGEELPEQHIPATIRDRIVVTADRGQTPIGQVGSSVTVITEAEIAARRATTVAELLRSVPGVSVAQSGGAGQVASVFIRGGSSSHTLVLIDGVRVNSATTGAYDFANLSTDGIARIEIVRGPQSTLYGSEAVAGVVSIITKRGSAGRELGGLAEFGTENHRRLSFSVAGASDRADYALTASSLRNDAISAASESGGSTEIDPYEHLQVMATAGYDLGGEARLELGVQHIDGQVAIDGFDFARGPVDALRATTSRVATVLRGTVTSTFGAWRPGVTLSINNDELTGEDGDSQFGNFVIESEITELIAHTDYAWDRGNRLTLGYEHERRRGGSVGSFEEQAEIDSAFVLVRLSESSAWALTAGARLDDHSQFGSESTFRLTGSAGFRRHRVHTSFGTGFKAPTLNDLYFPFFSNSDLSPETSTAFDVGLETRWLEDRLIIDMTWFTVDFEDLIAFDFTTFRPENVAAATSDGIEFGLGWHSSGDAGWSFDFSHTYNRTTDEGSGFQLARRPKNASSLVVSCRPTNRTRASITVESVVDRIDSDRSSMDDYEVFDLAFQIRANDRFEPYLRVENFLDEVYEEVNGFSSAGLTAVLGVSVKSK